MFIIKINGFTKTKRPTQSLSNPEDASLITDYFCFNWKVLFPVSFTPQNYKTIAERKLMRHLPW